MTSLAVRARAVAIISSGLTLIKRWERHPCLRRSKNLKATKQPIDTGTAAGKCFLEMLGVFAESKPTCAKNGRWRASRRLRLPASKKGRAASIDPAQVQQLKAQGMGPSQIAKHLGIARASVYRALKGH